ncbi:MAG: glycosyltransferase family 2 protein [Acidobacteria bacterium]|nr:glycosyltransferase family 2 protein [Acidobacteriota bacterium]
MKISGALITLDEEKNLPRALASLAFCDEIVVLDSGSADRTVELARQAGARVEQRAWTGYADQKNAVAALASHDWILSLDADEEVSPELAASIARLRAEGPAAAGYAFPRRARYLGRWIGHGGWYPDAKVRLYDRRKARWRGNYVHESVVADAETGRLDGDLLHYTCDTFSQHIQSVDRYTTLAARQMRAAGRRPSLARLVVAPPWTAFRTYVLQRGFLDGVQGLLIAAMAGFYVFAKYAKAREGEPG